MGMTDLNVSQNDLKNRQLRLYNYNKYLLGKKDLKVEARIQEELAPCTFTPQTTQYKKHRGHLNKSQSMQDRTQSPTRGGYFNQTLESGAQRHIVLYDVGKQYKERLQQKTYAYKKKEEIGELSYCTFQPKLNFKYETSDLRKQDFYQGVPNGFKKTVERLHKGEQQKVTKQAEQEKIPRGENYEKNKKSGFKPPALLSRPKVKRQEVLVYVDVSIGHGKTGRIGIHKGDNARTLAHHFSRTYSLNANMQDSLETLLQSYIDSYFAQASPNRERMEDDNNYNRRANDDDDDVDEDEDDEDDDEDDDEEERLEEVGEDEEEEERDI